jgi:Ring finger domain
MSTITPAKINENCSICLSVLKDGVDGEKTDMDLMAAKCGHVFHKTCLETHMHTPSEYNSGHKSCPNCRKALENVEIIKPETDGTYKKVGMASAPLLDVATPPPAAFDQINPIFLLALLSLFEQVQTPDLDNMEEEIPVDFHLPQIDLELEIFPFMQQPDPFDSLFGMPWIESEPLFVNPNPFGFTNPHFPLFLPIHYSD